MINITLPDGSQRQFDHAVTVAEIAAAIGAGLAKAALAGKVNDCLVDVNYLIEQDAPVSIITEKDAAGLDIIRHSTAHLLAHAVKSLFPSAQVTIGPVIEDGFYYDFAFERPFTLEDLNKIEQKMNELAKQNLSVSRDIWTREQAIDYFRGIGEEYKAKIIEDIPSNEQLSIYQQGDFIDLCRGPHVPATGKLKAFKLTKLAGAYWRGNSNNEMLQRIYGTAWADKKALDDYLFRIEEAEKRDHRKIAKIMDLFHIQEEAPGMAFWHENGWAIYQEVEQYIRKQLRLRDYQEVRTPQIVDRTLWEKSGHWDMFGKEMFTSETDERIYAIKPMNCPCHVQIFKQGLKSYRDLPIRLAEFGCCHRNEISGALHGLMRVRSMTQDDAHIFCTDDQLQNEAAQFIDFLFDVYRDFGFTDVIVRLATRPAERLGDDATWDRAEHALETALNNKNIKWELAPGEGAFYGPKLEFHLKDCLGRVWQCGTLQVDYAQPERLDAYYIAEDSSKQRPVMLHRAICGSLERFIAILIEHHAGNLPLWLAPVQAIVMNITDKQADYVEKITQNLRNNGFRVKSDLRNEKIGFKIRDYTLKRVPLFLIVGDRELETNTVSVRTRSGKDLGIMSLANFTDYLSSHIARRVHAEVEE